MSNVEIIQMKIKLDGIKPDIWRRFVIDSFFNLHELHKTIQIVMGWDDSHLYEFEIDGVGYGIPDEDNQFMDYVENSKKIKFVSLDLQPEDEFKYVYDFGDNWRHTIIFEKVLKLGELEYPVCLDGKRNCPPEDCGSIYGYKDMIKAMKKPKSDDAKEYIAWLGKGYDSELFDIERINKRLKTIKIRKKKNRQERIYNHKMNTYGYTILYVENVEETLAFYVKAFGFKQKFLTPEKDYGELDTGGTILSFASYSIAAYNGISVAKSDLNTTPAPFEIAFVADDIEETWQRAVNAGAVIVKEPTQKPWGQVVGYLRDKNGFLIEVCTRVG